MHNPVLTQPSATIAAPMLYSRAVALWNNPMIALRLTTCLILASIACVLVGCKPAPTPNAAQGQSSSEPVLQTPGDARRQPPSTAEVSNFVRRTLPSGIKLVDLKNDPPVPMPNTSPGSRAWVYNVRLTFALAEDEFGNAPAREAQAFQSAADELSALASVY